MKEKSRASHSWLGITLLLASAPSSLPGLLYACSSWATLEMPLAKCRKGCSAEDMTLDTLVCPCPKWAQKIPWSPLSYNRHYLIWSKKGSLKESDQADQKKVHWRNVYADCCVLRIKSLVLFTLPSSYRKSPLSLIQRPKTVPCLHYKW